MLPLRQIVTHVIRQHHDIAVFHLEHATNLPNAVGNSNAAGGN